MEENGDITAEDAPAAEESPELAEIPVAEEKPVPQIPSNIKVNQGKCLSLEIGDLCNLMSVKRIEFIMKCKSLFELLFELF